jgi:hypothetical protein
MNNNIPAINQQPIILLSAFKGDVPISGRF